MLLDTVYIRAPKVQGEHRAGMHVAPAIVESGIVSTSLILACHKVVTL